VVQPRACIALPLFLFAACAQHRPLTPTTSAPTEAVVVELDEGTGLAFDASRDGRWLVIDLLGQLWRVPADGGTAVPMTDAVRDGAEDREPAIAPDGRRVAFRGERGGRQGLWLLEADGSVRQLTQLANPDGYDGAAAWSPDGRSLAFTRLLLPDSAFPRPRSVLGILGGSGGVVRALALPGAVGPSVTEPAWHPDGRRVAVVARSNPRAPGGRIWLVDTAGGSATPLTDSVVHASGPAVSPTGDRIAYFAPDANGRIQVWVQGLEQSTPPPTRVTSHTDVTPTSIAWSRDGGRLLYGANGKLWSVARAGGAPVPIPFSARLSIRRQAGGLAPARFPQPGVSEPVRGFMGLSLSPDGRRIAMIALGALWVMDVGRSPREVARLPDDARYLSWAPDGAELAWSAGRLEHEDLFVTDLARGTTRRVTSLPGREALPAWSPDGRWIAFVQVAPQQEPRVRLASARGAVVSDTSGAQNLGPGHIDWTGSPAYAPVWSPDGSRILAPAPNYDAARPAQAQMLGLSGAASTVSLADSPIFVQWTAGALVYVRHARLWRLPFDSTGARGAPEPLGDAPALFPSVSASGDVLYVSEDGLVVRSSSGAERRLGWPLRYTPPVTGPLLIRNVRIIDGSGTPPSTPRDVLVERGRIARIEPAGTIRARADTLDAAGQFMIPGMMDLHAHIYAPELLPSALYFGITTMRDQGAPIGSVIAYSDAIAAGAYPGPRVSYGGFQFYSDWAFDAEDGQGIEPEADSAHVRRAVGLAAGLGAQHIKTRTFRRWDINARMVLEAHQRGLRTTGHCAHQLPLVAVGFDTKEHAAFCNGRDDAPIYSDLIRIYRAAGISVVPTVVYTGLAAKLDRPDYFESDRELAPFILPITSDDWMLRLDSVGRRRMAQTTIVARNVAAALVRAGVTIGTGTDVWQVPTAVHMELEELVAAGLTPIEAIRAATGDAARILGAERELGTIELGKRADLVLLTEDPTADIRNTRRISAVIQEGRVVNRAALRARYAAIRSP